MQRFIWEAGCCRLRFRGRLPIWNCLGKAAEKIYKSTWYQKWFVGQDRLGEKLKLLHPGERKDRLLEEYHCRKIQSLLLGLLMFSLLLPGGIALYVSKQKELAVDWVERPGYEAADRVERWEVRREDGTKGEVDLKVSGRLYTAEEAQKRLLKAEQELEARILGENESADRVMYPLVFPEALEDLSVTVQWFSDRPEIVNAQGQISEEYMEEEGTLVEIKAVLTCQSAEASYKRTFRVYPAVREADSMFFSRITASLKELEIRTRQEEGFALPSRQDGELIRFRKKGGNELILLAMLCLTAIILLYVWQDEKLGRALEERKEQLLADYPEIVSKLTVLLRAGLTAKPAFGKITADYRRRKEQDGILRYAYEELSIAYYEMANGMPEDRCYERFGKRCGLLPYMRLGGLLAQNVKTGNKSLLAFLSQEAGEALEERKRRAQKAGERAGTRMLAPMLLMLVVTIVIIIYPAFASFRI